MADSLTTTYSLTKPEAGASEDTWGTKTNTNWDSVDGLLDGTTVLEGPSLNSATTIVDAADNTKKLSFAVSGVSTATTRTWTVPNADGTFVGLTNTQALTNKTFTSAVMGGATDFSGASNKSTIRSDLGLEIGADVQGYTAALAAVTGTNTGDEDAATTSTAGIVEKATTAEMTAGTANKFPDAAIIKAFVDSTSNSVNSSGVYYLPGGLILQWGTVSSISQDTSKAGSFSTSFTSVFGLVLSPIKTLTTVGQGILSYSGLTTSGFTVNNGQDTTIDVFFIALGK